MKKVVMLFCDEDGEMIPSRHVDLITLGDTLRAQNLDIPPNISDNLANLLECFGEIDCDERIIQVIKEEKESKTKGKEAPLKKVGDQNEQPKPIDVLQKMTSYNEFRDAVDKIRQYDRMMCRLGLVRSNALKNEIEEQISQEEGMIVKMLSGGGQQVGRTEFDEFLREVSHLDKLPEVPLKA